MDHQGDHPAVVGLGDNLEPVYGHCWHDTSYATLASTGVGIVRACCWCGTADGMWVTEHHGPDGHGPRHPDASFRSVWRPIDADDPCPRTSTRW